MKRLLLGVAIASALGVAGCDSEDSIAELKQQAQDNGVINQPFSRVVFDPANARVSVPNDLLFSGTDDGTLVMPGEKDVDDNLIVNPDYTDPQTAIGALDGWSTSVPFALDLEMGTADATLDAASVAQPDAVHIFEAVIGGPLSPEAECSAAPAVSLCQLGAELAFGVDFVTQADGNRIIVVPLKPLKASQGYIIALTTSIMDSNGSPVQGSTTYEIVRRDITEFPLPLPSQLGLQALVNSYENGVAQAGVAKDSIIYTAAFTTQSIQDVFQTVKAVMAGVPGAAPVLTPLTAAGFSAGEALVMAGQLEAGSQPAIVAGFADVYTATLQAPYYLDKPTVENCDLTVAPFEPTVENCSSFFSRFTAMGDSPITVLGALQSGVLSQESFAAQYGVQAPLFGRGDFTGPADLVGMTFTVETPAGPMAVDQLRHTTQYNPWPGVKNVAQLDVLATMPNVAVINATRKAQVEAAGGTWDLATMGIEQPAAGWPVMIYQHGTPTVKENMYAFAGAMADAGIAVIAIDLPLHGSRAAAAMGPQGELEISASEGPFVTSYINLNSLLTGRDNVRQSEADLLSLRLAINGLAGTGVDVTKISFYGHSMGAIVGTAFVAMANTGIIDPATGQAASVNPYQISHASFLAPGGSLAGVLINSGSFSPLVKGGLTASDTFGGLLAEAALAQGIDAEALAALKDAGAPEYQALVDAVYAPFSAEFNFAAQTLLDSSDPINYAQITGATTPAVHVMEVVGDGENNLSDFVVPNNALSPDSALPLPLVGTDPLIALMGLAKVTETLGDMSGPVSGFVPFAKGHHSSILTPMVIDGVAPDAAANLAATVEMQTQLATFMATQGTVIKITDSSVIANE